MAAKDHFQLVFCFILWFWLVIFVIVIITLYIIVIVAFSLLIYYIQVIFKSKRNQIFPKFVTKLKVFVHLISPVIAIVVTVFIFLGFLWGINTCEKVKERIALHNYCLFLGTLSFFLFLLGNIWARCPRYLCSDATFDHILLAHDKRLLEWCLFKVRILLEMECQFIPESLLMQI